MLEVFDSLTEEEAQDEPILREYGIDFETGKLNGKIVEGKDALRVWIYFALKIARYRYRMFTWDYGNEFEDLIGTAYSIDYRLSEIERMTRECLTAHPNIQGISDFEAEFSGSTLKIRFTVDSDFGLFTEETEEQNIV